MFIHFLSMVTRAAPRTGCVANKVCNIYYSPFKKRLPPFKKRLPRKRKTTASGNWGDGGRREADCAKWHRVVKPSRACGVGGTSDTPRRWWREVSALQGKDLDLRYGFEKHQWADGH